MNSHFYAIPETDIMWSSCAEPAEMAVIIEGDALAVALEENNRMTFLQLCQKCRTVLCCRVSPLQKALVLSNG